MKLTYLGHSVVLLEGAGKTVLIDPFIDANPRCPVKVDDLSPDAVVVTHGHGDHWGNAMDYAKRGVQLVTINELAVWATRHGAGNVRPMGLGGRAQLDGFAVKFVPAWHSSSLPDGSYGGMPSGVVIELDGKRLYHAGDTALFSDMKLIGDLGLDLALLPIGDNFTMGPDDALKALGLLRPRAVVPIHYNTFPLIEQDGAAYARNAAGMGVQGQALAPGESLGL